jgi:hypothetical protein
MEWRDKEMPKNAQKRSQQISQQEECESLSLREGGSRHRQTSPVAECQPIGVDGDDWTRGNQPRLSVAISGGILIQLIQDAEDQLEQAEACIKWYEDEKRKIQQRLDNLRQLQDLQLEMLDNEQQQE